MAVMLSIIAVMFVVLATIFLRNTVVPKLLRLSGYIMAFMAAFMPIYTLTILNTSCDINAVYLIKGLKFSANLGYSMDIKGNIFYIFLFVLPVLCSFTVIKDNKFFNIISAFLSVIGVLTCTILVFKQLEIGSVIKISINIGMVIMFLSYGLSLAISIIKIYSFINVQNEDKPPIEPVNIGEENIEDYFRDSVLVTCRKCGEKNVPNCNFCKKCGEKLKGE
ncbi:MAG: hypothetical protein ACI4VF_05110 [Lachnospirales bacterium]